MVDTADWITNGYVVYEDYECEHCGVIVDGPLEAIGFGHECKALYRSVIR
jgi:hypothetical protein